MYKTVTFGDFRDAFYQADRGDQFTYDGARLLFDYLEEIEADTGTPIELDVVALCCDFCEDPVADLADQHDITLDPDEAADMDATEQADALKEAVLDYLNDQTAVCGATDDTIVYVVF